MTDAFITILKALSSLSTLIMFASPAPSIYRIYKSKIIGEVSIIPLVSLWASTHSWYVSMLSGFNSST